VAKIEGKLKELILEGEGHLIWKTPSVIKALKKSGFGIEEHPKELVVILGEKKGIVYLETAPVHSPKSKYDTVSWKGSKEDTGIHDLALLSAICYVMPTKYDGRSFGGRGFQYREYLEWLKKENYLKEE